MSRFTVEETRIPGVFVITRNPLTDKRGFFERLFCEEELAACGWVTEHLQVNHSLTAASGTVRGIHLQAPPFCEMKYVSCIAGEIWDVAVDLRKGSPTFLQSFGTELTATNHRSLLIPQGVGHGFQATSENATIIYTCSQHYEHDAQVNINPIDSRLDIKWPQPITAMSKADEQALMLDETFTGLSIPGAEL